MNSSSRVALVTGATSGIGREIALQLAREGWRVAAVGRRKDRLIEIASLSDDLSGVITGYPCDLSHDEDRDRMVDAVRSHQGAIHALVNAAGVLEPGSIDNTSLAQFDRIMDVNVRAVFALTQAVVPALREAGRGHIVNVSSVAGPRPYPNLSAYCVSKAALDHLTRCLAIELAPEGIQVNAVNPGVVVTELHKRGGMDDAAYAAFLERGQQTHPLGRVGTPTDVANLVTFLLSGRAGWITGETILIDGGRHLTSLR
jgi:NAD(P)-dependent dehydrogenase (short-subunit alcohol dehydrogenase family)